MGSERWASIGLSYRRFGAFWSVQWTGKWRETEGGCTLPAQTRAPHHPRARGSALRPQPQSRTQGYALRQHNCPSLVPPWIFRDTGKAQPVRTSAQWDRPGLQSMRQFCWHVDVPLGWMNSDYSRGRARGICSVAAGSQRWPSDRHFREPGTGPRELRCFAGLGWWGQ